MNNGYTPTQHRMISLLSDGRPHTRKELHACLDDDLAQLSAIQRHITEIRKHLTPYGEDIVCRVMQGTFYYQHVRLISNANDGRT